MVETNISQDTDAKKAMIAGAIVVVVLGMVFAFSRSSQNSVSTGSSQTGTQAVQSDNGQAMQSGGGSNQGGLQTR